MSRERWNQILVPAGFAHGFVTLEADTEVVYKVSAPYDREADRAVRFDDPAIGIEWPADLAPFTLSAKDEKRAASRRRRDGLSLRGMSRRTEGTPVEPTNCRTEGARVMPDTTTFLVTGGAGFIGSAVCRRLVRQPRTRVVCYDKLTYAGNVSSLKSVEERENFTFVQGDIGDAAAVRAALDAHGVDIVMNLAAESHVDRSIDGPGAFIETNVVGTFRLLDAARGYHESLAAERRERFRFHHISTDEVFGDLPFATADDDGGFFTEQTPYAPSSPYSASKAASDHLVRAWHETYGLPVVMTNCSNNYGPFHFPEKLIPLVVLNALEGRPLPVYGRGENVRDWLHVEDHAAALERVARDGQLGESYNVGGNAERTNLAVVEAICDALDGKRLRAGGGSRRDLIAFVGDRPGHDRRYAIDASKIRDTLGWEPSRTFEEGLSDTIDWYLANEWWWGPIRQTDASRRRGAPSASTAAQPAEPA